MPPVSSEAKITELDEYDRVRRAEFVKGWASGAYTTYGITAVVRPTMYEINYPGATGGGRHPKPRLGDGTIIGTYYYPGQLHVNAGPGSYEWVEIGRRFHIWKTASWQHSVNQAQSNDGMDGTLVAV